MSDILVHPQQNINFSYRESPQTRQGDWICLKCNNLNFSFRKKCNRCKTQTRQQNDENLRYVYQYYQGYYEQTTNFGHNNSDSNLQTLDQTPLQVELMNIGDHFCISQQLIGQKYVRDLPSVSPIVKRYKIQKTISQTQHSCSQSSDQEQFYSPKEFLHEYCWKNILIDQDIESQMNLRDPSDYWDIQIEKIVQNIVI